MPKIAAIALAAATLAAAAPARGAIEEDANPGYVPLHRYLVTTSHSPEQCLSALDEMAAQRKSTLKRMEWGCASGDHTGYMFVLTRDRESALSVLPESSRATARVVEVTTFTPRQLKKLHAKAQQPAAAATQAR